MNVNRSFRAAVGWALPVLVAWAVLAALWNFGAQTAFQDIGGAR